MVALAQPLRNASALCEGTYELPWLPYSSMVAASPAFVEVVHRVRGVAREV